MADLLTVYTNSLLARLAHARDEAAGQLLAGTPKSLEDYRSTVSRVRTFSEAMAIAEDEMRRLIEPDERSTHRANSEVH